MTYENIKVNSVEEGKQIIVAIQALMQSKLQQMSECDNNITFRVLSDERYQLLKAKRDVQNQITKLFLARRAK
jgi:plasmid maintenance system killer protein